MIWPSLLLRLFYSCDHTSSARKSVGFSAPPAPGSRLRAGTGNGKGDGNAPRKASPPKGERAFRREAGSPSGGPVPGRGAGLFRKGRAAVGSRKASAGPPVPPGLSAFGSGAWAEAGGPGNGSGVSPRRASSEARWRRGIGSKRAAAAALGESVLRVGQAGRRGGSRTRGMASRSLDGPSGPLGGRGARPSKARAARRWWSCSLRKSVTAAKREASAGTGTSGGIGQRLRAAFENKARARPGQGDRISSVKRSGLRADRSRGPAGPPRLERVGA